MKHHLVVCECTIKLTYIYHNFVLKYRIHRIELELPYFQINTEFTFNLHSNFVAIILNHKLDFNKNYYETFYYTPPTTLPLVFWCFVDKKQTGKAI